MGSFHQAPTHVAQWHVYYSSVVFLGTLRLWLDLAYMFSAGLADAASKAGDAKDNVQSVANKVGLEWCLCV